MFWRLLWRQHILQLAGSNFADNRLDDMACRRGIDPGVIQKVKVQGVGTPCAFSDVLQGRDAQGRIGVCAGSVGDGGIGDFDFRYRILSHPGRFCMGEGGRPKGTSFETWAPYVLTRRPGKRAGSIQC